MAEFAPFSMNASDCNKFFDELVKYVKLPKQKAAEQVSGFSNQFTPSVAIRTSFTGTTHEMLKA